MDGWKEGWMDGSMEGRMQDGWMDGWMHIRTWGVQVLRYPNFFLANGSR